MNDRERARWVENDEELYRRRLSERLSVSRFVRLYRAEIDSRVRRILDAPPRARQWWEVE